MELEKVMGRLRSNGMAPTAGMVIEVPQSLCVGKWGKNKGKGKQMRVKTKIILSVLCVGREINR